MRGGRRRFGEAGIITVEFAVVAPILITLLGAATDLGLAVERSIRLSSAARAGALYAAQAPGDTTNAAKSFVSSLLSDLSGVNVPTLTISCQCPSSTSVTTGPTVSCTSNTCTTGVAQYITVVVTAPFTSIFPLSAKYLPFETIGATSGRVVARIS